MNREESDRKLCSLFGDASGVESDFIGSFLNADIEEVEIAGEKFLHIKGSSSWADRNAALLEKFVQKYRGTYRYYSSFLFQGEHEFVFPVNQTFATWSCKENMYSKTNREDKKISFPAPSSNSPYANLGKFSNESSKNKNVISMIVKHDPEEIDNFEASLENY